MIVVLPTMNDSEYLNLRASKPSGSATTSPANTDTTVIQRCCLVAAISSGLRSFQ